MHDLSEVAAEPVKTEDHDHLDDENGGVQTGHV